MTNTTTSTIWLYLIPTSELSWFANTSVHFLFWATLTHECVPNYGEIKHQEMLKRNEMKPSYCRKEGASNLWFLLWWFLVFAGYLTMGFTAQPSFFPVLLIGKKVILWSKIFFFKFFALQFSACQTCLFCLSLVRYEQQLLQSVHLRHSWSK